MPRLSHSKQIIPVVDLFAGPGGLGEGFSSVVTANGRQRFRIALSVEKDEIAHETLELRAFFRQSDRPDFRKAYHRFLRRQITREDLFKSFRQEADAARTEAWQKELTSASQHDVIARVQSAIGRASDSILIGGPPCQAYSLVGRSRNAGNPEYRPADDERHTLYQAYLRVLSQQWPCVFVFENVKGLLSATLDGKSIFGRILDDLRDPQKALKLRSRTTKAHRYEIMALETREDEQTDAFDTYSNDLTRYVVKSEEHGVPQRRHRIILVGIREDFLVQKRLVLSSQPGSIARQVLMDLPPVRSGVSAQTDSRESWSESVSSVLGAKWFRQLQRTDSAVAARIESAVAQAADALWDRGSEFVEGIPSPELERSWFRDARLGGFCNHSTRAHMTEDLQRYLFAASFAAIRMRSPTLEDFPRAILPDHKNVGRALNGSLFADRFRVQSADRPSTTITSHIAKDGHYYIHYDPAQCRSLTVREAARLQTFPDNYFFCGPRTSQYHQVGNAVPPLLARQIAAAISDYLG